MRLKQLELDALALAKAERIDEAILGLTKAIDLCPEYPSAYNNRSQAYRIKNMMPEALKDIDNAIRYGQHSPSILSQAYTQRAIIHKRNGNDVESEQDFLKGSLYGNPVAKAMVQNNPYAKLYIYF